METRREKSQSAAAGQVLKHGMNLNFRKKSWKTEEKKEMPLPDQITFLEKLIKQLQYVELSEKEFQKIVRKKNAIKSKK